MNKPPIKQKPVIKPKPPAKPVDLLKGKLNNLKLNEESISDETKKDESSRNDRGGHDSQPEVKQKDQTKDQSNDQTNGKSGRQQSGIFHEFDRLSSQDSTTISDTLSESQVPSDSTFSQKVLDQAQLQKAFQLLNQGSLPDKEDAKYDIRVDEDQIETCQQIIAALLEAGYYRANIVGLSEFDKIIGGMVWCIELCNIDIDVDLFYQDSLTIGQKISLTEKIVNVLNIKCPHQLKPHQIQGLDCISILPVVQWLIKESHEFGIQIKDYIDLFAAHRFDCDHGGSVGPREDLLVISRSKEAKRLIKEYFNKNEVKINLELRLEECENDLRSLTALDEQLDEDGERLAEEIRAKEQDCGRIEEECTRLVEQLVEHQTTEKKQLAQQYSQLVDELKQLKATNKSTKGRMKREYESLLAAANVEVDGELEQQLQFEQAKLAKLKAQLAEKNKSYLVLRRKYDNILSKEEMSQYQKRFVELSAQVANKLNETKKFFILYNQLDSTKKQLENKFSFFDSLLKAYSQLNPNVASPMNQQFIQQLEQKIESLRGSLISIQQKNQSESNRKKLLEQQHVELIEMKRLYYRTVKELKEEISRKAIR